METTKRMVDFIVRSSYGDLPAEVIERGKGRVLDTLACMLAAVDDDAAVLIREYAGNRGGAPEASIVASARRTSAPMAALVNGTIGHVLDFDDFQPSFGGHPSVVILPAALAVGEKMHASGRAVLEAFLLGFEGACKIGSGVNLALYERGWHATSVIGVLGAAMATGKLLGLDATKMAYALAIAASSASGLRGNFGTMTKPLHAGKGAEGGVAAALLAASGFTASTEILEHKNGFSRVFSTRFDPVAMTGRLGDPFDIVSPGIQTKLYPSCLMTHPVIEAARALAQAYHIDPDRVDSVECRIGPLAADNLIHMRPQTGLEAKFSAPYAVAVALLNTEISLAHFTDERVQDPRARELVEKVQVIVDEGINAPVPPAWVTVRTKDGREWVEKGDIEGDDQVRGITLDRIVKKYRECASLVLDEDRIGRSIEMVLGLEILDDIARLMTTIHAVNTN
jgi:2-methylcitrate dehydratase PrpD